MGRIKQINGHYYDTCPANKSFLQFARDLKLLGVKNWYFCLEIFDYTLLKIDPHAKDKKTGKCLLTKDQIERVNIECRRNPWYYLRECSRIEDPGNPDGIPYKANRGNMAQAWCFVHGIDSWLCLPRQIGGKTQSALAIQGWAYSYGTTNTGFIFINKDFDGSKENLSRLSTQIRLLPEYMQFKWVENEDGKIEKEKDNAQSREHPVTHNRIKIKAAATSYAKALSLARGLTTAIQHSDETEFTNFIGTIIENSVSTFQTAADRAKENHSMYGRIFTSTPGDLDTQAGQESQQIIDGTNRWTDKMYDMTKEEMEEYARAGNSNTIVYIEYQYYQLGYDRKWLDTIASKIGNMLTVRREILLQRLRGSSLSPYPREDIEYIMDQAQDPVAEIFLLKYFKFDLYVKELNPGIPYIVGVDCSTGTVKDYNAITIIDPYKVEPVGEFECSYIGETKYEQLIIELVTKYIPKAIVCIERNSVGDGILDHLLNSKISNRLYYDKAKNLQEESINQYENVPESMLKKLAQQKLYYGVYTSGSSRETMFTILSRHVSEFKSKFITRNISRDISRLVRTPSGKIEAAKGFHDDSIMSYLIGMYVFYHGNNLHIFGYDPKNAEDDKPNKGLEREITDIDTLRELLPPDAVKAIMDQKKIEKMSQYEEIFKEAMLESQEASKKLMDSKLNFTSTLDPDDLSYDDGYSIPLDLFDELNNI